VVHIAHVGPRTSYRLVVVQVHNVRRTRRTGSLQLILWTCPQSRKRVDPVPANGSPIQPNTSDSGRFDSGALETRQSLHLRVLLPVVEIGHTAQSMTRRQCLCTRWHLNTWYQAGKMAQKGSTGCHFTCTLPFLSSALLQLRFLGRGRRP
jgi:hypothetical protein